MTININGNTYPVFEANQVLKHTDLKGLFDYLDGHHRLTRTHLIGMGLVCGLTVEFDPKATRINVSSGCGVTSEGYLIHLTAAVSLGYYQSVDVSESLFQPTSDLDVAIATAGSNGSGNGGSSIPSTVPVIELFATSTDDRLPLTQTPDGSDIQEFIASHVVVLVCELDDIKRDSCLADCDSRGRDRNLRTRFFLLPKTGEGDQLTAEKLLRQGYAFDDLGAAWAGLGTEAVLTANRDFWSDPHLRVRRFGYGEETPPDTTQAVPMVRLSAIKNFAGLMANYYEICDRAIADIASAFPRLFRLFSPFFSTFHPDTTADFSSLEERLTSHLQTIWSPESPDPAQQEPVEAQYAMQYFYDYLSQLVAAYDELATAAFDLMDDCAPDSRRFPKFLMLGEPTFPTTADPCPVPSAYRHHFVQPPIYNGNQQRVQQVHHLYQRLHRLCADDAFLMLPFYDTPLAITPSPNRAAPLSQQAIPYYLNYPQIYSYWNYDACRKGISDRHPAYFHPRNAGESVTTLDVLTHRLDPYSFYRIEGHIGETNATALEQIKTYRDQYNLAFDVITLKLAPTIDSLDDLNIAGSFDDLEADYGRMKDKFLKLWDKHEQRQDPQERWSRNVFLTTLRRSFFNESATTSQSGLNQIRESLLRNPILALASNPDQYTFVAETSTSSPPGRYWLYVVDQNRSPQARFSPQSNLTPNDDLIDFSGLSEEQIAAEQTRIRETLAACFGLGKVRFELITQISGNQPNFFVRLSVGQPLDLPNPDLEASEEPRIQVATGLLWLSPFRVSTTADQYYIEQPEFHDFETLYSLLRDVPPEFGRELRLPYRLGDRLAADCLNYFELKGPMEVYGQRLERLKELHLFHKFAAYHPGLEPLGGVPKGGTFVLVYVDRSELADNLLEIERNLALQTRGTALLTSLRFPPELSSTVQIQQEVMNRADIVVADFCLPYQCCSTTPTVSYVLAQPRPIVLLERSAFCRDDDATYEFMLDPAGGILKGEGSYLEGQTYYFQPSRVGDFTNERTITFTYAVEGSYDTFTVVIYPEPTGSLNLENEGRFCNNADPVELRLIADPSIELLQVTIDERVIDRFDPREYAQENEPETVTLVAQLRDRRTNCEATVETTVTVYPLPNPAFGFRPAPNSETGGYCYSEGEDIDMVPEDRDVSVRFEIRGEAAGSVSLNENSISLYNLRSWFNDNPRPATLTVVHLARNEPAGCEAWSAEQTITIYPTPNPSFSLSTNNVCSNGDPVDILLEFDEENFTLEALEAFASTRNREQISLSPNTNPPQFDPKLVPDSLFGNQNSLRIDIVVRGRGAGNCPGSDTRTITVYRTPTARFELGDIRQDGIDSIVTVRNIQPNGNLSGLNFEWNFDGGTPSRGNTESDDFTVAYRQQADRPRVITITLQVRNRRPDNLNCSSLVVERSLEIPGFPGLI